MNKQKNAKKTKGCINGEKKTMGSQLGAREFQWTQKYIAVVD
jgi:hypothetical protein